MPQLDSCHPQVVKALEKDGWIVGEDPYLVTIPGRRPLFIDLYAHRQEAGESRIIIVEVKCFPEGRSELTELYTAIGQYLVYRNLLRQNNVTDTLYLAIPSDAYHTVFQQLAAFLRAEIQLKMIVVDIEREVIEQWLE